MCGSTFEGFKPNFRLQAKIGNFGRGHNMNARGKSLITLLMWCNFTNIHHSDHDHITCVGQHFKTLSPFSVTGENSQFWEGSKNERQGKNVI